MSTQLQAQGDTARVGDDDSMKAHRVCSYECNVKAKLIRSNVHKVPKMRTLVQPL